MAEAARVPLERVVHAPLQAAASLPALLEREPELLDIQEDGAAVHAERTTPADLARAQRLQLWAERGDFAAVHAADLAPCAPVTQASLLEQLLSMHAPADSPEAHVPVRTGTIPESEFFPLRDQMLQQLESALFNAEQAQNLLGMLLHNARGQPAEGTALAAQPEYFLDPHTLSLSQLQRGEDDAQLPNDRKLVLEEKQQSLRRAAAILARGASELEESAKPERARWAALSRIQKRGWKLTPGRPLVDMERFDRAHRASVLDGFGTPLLQGSGTLSEEGARDAWIGYGPAEAPVPLLQRTLAYWADASDGAAELAFPDRTWRRLRVSFSVTGAEPYTWTSAPEGLTEQGGLDAQLCDASLDAVDTQLFDEIAAHSGTLSPILARTVSPTSITLPLASHVAVVMALVPHDAPAAPRADTSVSPWASLLLAVLRLRMLRNWSQRVIALQDTRIGMPPPAMPRADLMAPVWSLYQYTLVRPPANPVPRTSAHGAGSCRGACAGRIVRMAPVRDARQRPRLARIVHGPRGRHAARAAVWRHGACVCSKGAGGTALPPCTKQPPRLFPAAHHQSAPPARTGVARDPLGRCAGNFVASTYHHAIGFAGDGAWPAECECACAGTAEGSPDRCQVPPGGMSREVGRGRRSGYVGDVADAGITRAAFGTGPSSIRRWTATSLLYVRVTHQTFGLGTSQVIRGWDEGLVGMCVGEKRRLQLPPRFGYGEHGAGKVIPPDATLVFDVELLDIRGPRIEALRAAHEEL